MNGPYTIGQGQVHVHVRVCSRLLLVHRFFVCLLSGQVAWDSNI